MSFTARLVPMLLVVGVCPLYSQESSTAPGTPDRVAAVAQRAFSLEIVQEDYHAGKLHLTLYNNGDQLVTAFAIQVTMVEPGGYGTNQVHGREKFISRDGQGGILPGTYEDMAITMPGFSSSDVFAAGAVSLLFEILEDESVAGAVEHADRYFLLRLARFQEAEAALMRLRSEALVPGTISVATATEFLTSQASRGAELSGPVSISSESRDGVSNAAAARRSATVILGFLAERTLNSVERGASVDQAMMFYEERLERYRDIAFQNLRESDIKSLER